MHQDTVARAEQARPETNEWVEQARRAVQQAERDSGGRVFALCLSSCFQQYAMASDRGTKLSESFCSESESENLLQSCQDRKVVYASQVPTVTTTATLCSKSAHHT